MRSSQEATGLIIENINETEGIEVLGEPDMCMFTLASGEVNIFEVDDEMSSRSWKLIPQFACGGSPANLHISLTRANLPHVELFISDLREVVEKLRNGGAQVDVSALHSLVDEVVDASLEEIMGAIVLHIGLNGPDLPERMAPLNTVLNRIPADKRDWLLTFFFNMA